MSAAMGHHHQAQRVSALRARRGRAACNPHRNRALVDPCFRPGHSPPVPSNSVTNHRQPEDATRLRRGAQGASGSTTYSVLYKIVGST